MTDTEMLEYCKDNFPFAITTESGWNDIKMVFKEGFEQGTRKVSENIMSFLFDIGLTEEQKDRIMMALNIWF